MTICRHFGVCGGCRSEPGGCPPPYADELQEKERRVRDLLAAFDVGDWRPIVPSPAEWQYRNKMEFAFGQTREMPFRLGLREAGRFDRIVDLETCALISPDLFALVGATRDWAAAEGLSGYNRFSHQGDLRYLVVRKGLKTDQTMAVLIAREAPRGLDRWREAVQPRCTTGWLGVTDARGDVARTQDMRLLWGPGTIDERLGGVVYRISPYSFFQTNTSGAEALYERLRAWAGDLAPGGALLDLYCGSGGIALALADRFDRVLGIDTNADAIRDAQANALANGLGNAEFVCEDVREFLKKLPGSKLAVQLAAAVVDPPRAGLHPKALGALLEINPARLAYVSCNPESLARDLQALVPFYAIGSVQAMDLFPHTAHVETVALLEHR